MDAIAEFTRKLHDDPELLARVQAAPPGERHALLEAGGIKVTPELQEEARATAERHGIDPADANSWSEVELSEEELTALAGGVGLGPALVGSVGIAVFLAGVAMAAG